MYNSDTDLIFSPRILPDLRHLRGLTWQELVKFVIEAGPGSHEQITFILMMARMNKCTTCNSDSYRAINGCTACSQQTITHFRDSDQALAEIFHSSKTEVEQQLRTNNTMTNFSRFILEKNNR